MDSPAESADSSNESPAQRQARLRREKRQAKIMAEGASRLDKITNASGRPAPGPEEPSLSTPSPVPARPPPPSAAQDPEEVDISQHYYAPSSRSSTPAQQQARENAAMQAFNPLVGSSGNEQMNQDPMLQMLQAMMGGAGGPGAGFPGAQSAQGGTSEGLPPGFAELLGAMGGAGGPGVGQKDEVQGASNTANIWRIVHALFSLTLGIYVALGSNFTGSAHSRKNPPISSFSESAHEHHQTVGQRLFYLFATFEVMLQSSRYFLEKGQLPGSGWLRTISGFLPEPYAGYVRIVGRYSMIYTTVMSDVMVVLFVLGLAAWWRGGVA